LTRIFTELCARLLEHRLGEVCQHTVTGGIFTQDCRREDSIAATQVQKAFDGFRARLENRDHHTNLLLRQRDRGAMGEKTITTAGSFQI
jgi:hypothetical protein